MQTMAYRRSGLWAVMTLLLVVTTVSSGSADDLSLKQAIELALANNPVIASARHTTNAAQQTVRSARALSNPEITVAPTVAGDAGSDSAVLFSQPLEINGSRRVRGQVAAYEATAAKLDAETTRREVVRRVSEVYWDVARALELVRLNQDNLAYIETLGAAVQKQYDVGAIPGAQVLKTDVELARARQDMSQAQLEYSQAAASLNSLLNRSMDHQFTVADKLTFSDKALDRVHLQAMAQDQRPEIMAAEARTEAARRQIRAARLTRAPDLALQARKETFDSGGEEGVAIAITLPFIDWGSSRAEGRRADSHARSQEKTQEAVRNSVALDVEQAIQQVETSSKIVQEYQRGILDRSEELAQMAQLGYERGATSYLEVLEAQRTLRSARTEYYTALANHAKSLAQLEWAIGDQVSDGAATEASK